MSSVHRKPAPKMRPVPANRTTLVAALDIGTSKVACMIARLKPCAPSDALVGRTHAIEVIGLSYIQSRGIKAGAVVDSGEAERAVRQAVAMAERSAGVRVESVLLSVSGGRLQGQLIEASADIRGGTVAASDIGRVMSAGARHATGEGRTVLHALPVGYMLDGVKGVRDPKGMVARQFGIEANVVTADAAAVGNLMLVVERCHLTVEAIAAGPYVAGLSVLTDGESDLSAAVVDLGAGTTTIATYSSGRFVHASGFAVGGHHVTTDLARGIGASITDAERIKTLYGTVLPGGLDARELMTIPSVGDQERDAPRIVSRGAIANIVRQRVEEIFEMVRDRLAESPLASEPGARVVITGGASQLTGMPDLASQILNRPVRVGRPLGLGRLPNEAKNPSFAVAAGLLVYPQFAHLEHVEPRRTRNLRTGTDGYFGKVSQWLRDGF
jgi:cell division protein FtsA